MEEIDAIIERLETHLAEIPQAEWTVFPEPIIKRVGDFIETDGYTGRVGAQLIFREPVNNLRTTRFTAFCNTAGHQEKDAAMICDTMNALPLLIEWIKRHRKPA